VVVVAGFAPDGYGNRVVVAHGAGERTLYAHLSRVLVHDGAAVAQGATIGRVGSTGFSTGPHLHFEVRVRGAAIDPAGALR
jgi:murein DD-endopeptidase MepM/ murein hydrolase activator NlpD